MAAVVVEFAGKELMRVSMRGPLLTVGRDPTTDIHLDHRSLSRRHAQIERRGAALWVRDLDSHNGTFVNGKRIEEAQVLVEGDIIEVGRYRLSLDGVEVAAGDTPVLTLSGPEGTHRFAMVEAEIVLGRASSCDIAITHQSISRRHLRLWREGNVFLVEDLGSQNGTKLHGKRIQGPTRIEVGDQVQLSEFTLELGLLQQGPLAGREGATPPAEPSQKTMMIDRSELAKAAYVDGDFEQVYSAAGRIALGRPPAPHDNRGEKHNTGEFHLHEDSVTRGLPQDPSTGAARTGPRNRTRTRQVPWLTVTHPDIDDFVVDLTADVTLLGEDGSLGSAETARGWAEQAYLLVARTPEGLVAAVVGDRRLVTVNGHPTVFARLQPGDTLELGVLTALFHSESV